ncbi:helix-turn-helix domain-containing protein [Actinokineospora xionganensis]|uniref:Helix-turn-helix domain-containing protein n=1 Tax=Actinokineospora xionganensis TaxID=2684470 RepID=A0ABR7L9I8_9PSEU|nr:helix-turn-helix transcriptional regulator [Actinokineospora xionganensis]MBC6449340.1 helix-turn-helix domain-containing protein [Actinokineospora xionganensis]
MSGVSERGLGMELRKFRERAGMTCAQVGEVLGWSANTVSRMERGLRRDTRPDEVSALLAGMGVTGNERAMVMRMATGHREQGWWEGTDTNLSDQARTYMAFEAKATNIVDVEPLLVPGLLQTPDYYRALLAACAIDPLDMNHRIARRLGRQVILDRPYASFAFVVSELMLRQPLGGHEVMARQTRRLLKEALRPNVSVLVLPTSVAAHPGLLGAFVVLEFADEPPVVFVEGRQSAMFPENPSEIETYRMAAESLVALALDQERSARVLDDIAEEHERAR